MAALKRACIYLIVAARTPPLQHWTDHPLELTPLQLAQYRRTHQLVCKLYTYHFLFGWYIFVNIVVRLLLSHSLLLKDNSVKPVGRKTNNLFFEIVFSLISHTPLWNVFCQYEKVYFRDMFSCETSAMHQRIKKGKCLLHSWLTHQE